MSRQNDDRSYRLKYFNQVEAKAVSWLWYPYFPAGKITIVQGDPGEGKTTMMLQLAALLTQGKKLPDGTELSGAVNVIFQGAEDGVSDTIKPRLLQAGADCSRIAFIDPEEDRSLSLGDRRFERAIRETEAKLLIIDPLQAFLSAEPEKSRRGSLRNIFGKLGKVAEETGCAVVLIGHMNKNGSGKSIYRGLGSIDVAAIARSVLLVGRDSDDPYRRIMLPIKSSLAPEGPAFAFDLDPVSGFRWVGACSYTADELLGNAPHVETKLQKAKDSLQEILYDNDLPGREVYEKMYGLGIGKRTIDAAKKAIGVSVYRKDDMWYWHLDSGEANG